MDGLAAQPLSERQLAVMTETLSRAVTTLDILELLLEHGFARLGVSAVSLGVMDGDGSWISISTVGFAEEATERFPDVHVDAPLPGPAVVRDGTERWYESASGACAEFPAAAEVVASTPFEAAGVVPLQDRGVLFGYLAVHATEVRSWSEWERADIRALGGLCAITAARTRHVDTARAALARLEGLQRFSAAVSSASYAHEVADALVAHGVDAMRARAGAVHLRAGAGAQMRLAGSRGWPPAETQRFDGFLLGDDLPAAAVANSGTPVYYETPTDLIGRYPSLSEVQQAVGDGAWAIGPIMADGAVLGTFGVTFEFAHHIPQADRDLLVTLGQLAGQALDRAHHYELAESTASFLQRALLPTRVVAHPSLEIAARYVPAQGTAKVGGDWYDVYVDEDDVVLVIGDVAGHGLGAARTMGRVRFGLAALATLERDPATLLVNTNRYVMTSGRDDMITCAVLRVDTATRRITWASAGHPPALLLDASDASYLDGATGVPLGTTSDPNYANLTVEVGAGTRIVMFTDGLIERRHESLADGLQRLQEAVSATRGLDSEDLSDLLLATQPDGTDDTALIAVRVR